MSLIETEETSQFTFASFGMTEVPRMWLPSVATKGEWSYQKVQHLALCVLTSKKKELRHAAATVQYYLDGPFYHSH